VAKGVFQAIAVLARSELRLAGREDVADRLVQVPGAAKFLGRVSIAVSKRPIALADAVPRFHIKAARCPRTFSGGRGNGEAKARSRLASA
jgi:hypothetical protein